MFIVNERDKDASRDFTFGTINVINKLQETFGPKSVAYKKKNSRRIVECCNAKEDNRLFKTFPYKKRTIQEKNVNVM